MTDQSKRFATNYRLARQKLEIAGLSQALGEALLQQRQNLPRARDFSSAPKNNVSSWWLNPVCARSETSRNVRT